MSALMGRDAKRFERFKSSLGYVAQLLEKNPRTIRRWCESGLIPGAYRTGGGQWRVSGMSAAIVRGIQAKARTLGFFPRGRKAKPGRTRLSDLRAKLRAKRPQKTVHDLARELMLTGAKLRKQEVEEEVRLRKLLPPEVFYNKQGFSEEQEAAIEEAPSAKLLKAIALNPFRAELIIESRNLSMILKKMPITRRLLASKLCIAEITLKRRMIENGISMKWIRERLFDWR